MYSNVVQYEWKFYLGSKIEIYNNYQRKNVHSFYKLIKIIKNKIKKCIFSKVDWKIKEIKYSI